MKLNDVQAVSSRLSTFAEEVFASLSRADQRSKGLLYLKGAMLDGRRKSMQPMAERLGVDHQQLQQFVTSSPWKFSPVRGKIARMGQELIGESVWVIDDTGFKKDGVASACVARQYSGTLGKVGNCQIAVSVHMASDKASLPANWRLYVPQSWDDLSAETNDEAAAIQAKREIRRIPDNERHREKWRMGLEMIDELISWGIASRTVCADAGYGNTTEFRAGLTERKIPYVLSVNPTTSAQPQSARPEIKAHKEQEAKPSRASYPMPPLCLKDLALAAGRENIETVTWRQGTKVTLENPDAHMTSQFLRLSVRPANRNIAPDENNELPKELLLLEWPENAHEPTDYWLSTLPENTPTEHLVRIAKRRWRIEHDYRELKTGLGLTHYEGRSWIGWNHHTTLISAAHLFLTTLRVEAGDDPKVPGAR